MTSLRHLWAKRGPKRHAALAITRIRTKRGATFNRVRPCVVSRAVSMIALAALQSFMWPGDCGADQRAANVNTLVHSTEKAPVPADATEDWGQLRTPLDGSTVVGGVLNAVIANAASVETTAEKQAVEVAACLDGRKVSAPRKGTLIGINYFDAFSRYFKSGKDTSFRRGFAGLHKFQIPFIRFSLTGFWPDDLAMSLEQTDQFLERFDKFVAEARSYGIRLLPTVFWNYAALPGYSGESLAAWGNGDSRTRGAMRRLVKTLAERYSGNPAIIGWEFTNEANSFADLPDSYKYYKIDPKLDPRGARKEDNNVTSRDLLAALAEFGEIVKSADPRVIISSGFDVPRINATRLRRRAGGLDTEAEFVQALRDQSAVAVNSVSVHIYPDTMKRYQYRAVNVNTLLDGVFSVAANTGRVPFVGEFGVQAGEGDGERRQFEELLGAIGGRDGGLAALWVFDFSYQDGVWNVTTDNARAYQLEAVARSNLGVACR